MEISQLSARFRAQLTIKAQIAPQVGRRMDIAGASYSRGPSILVYYISFIGFG